MKRRLAFVSWKSLVLWSFTASLFGQAGSAINFQNATFESHGDFVYCGAPNYVFTNQLTVSAWIKWTIDPGTFARSTKHGDREGYYATYIAHSTHNPVITSSSATEHGQFWLRNNKTANKIEFIVETVSGIQKTVTSTTLPRENTWYYLTGTYDGSTVKLYVDGVEEASIGLAGNIRDNTDCRLNMGRLPWGYGLFVGYLDEVRVWNIALTPTEIQNQQNSKATIQNEACLSYWNFDAGSGTAITDTKGLANGTFYSALIDVHGASVDLANKIIEDADRSFVTGAWNGRTLVTVAGTGVGETNMITSNSGNIFTLQNGFVTTPVLDGITSMTWFGILPSGESSQWVSSSDIALPVSLGDFSAKMVSGNVVLSWSTESETENLGFTISRKTTAAGRTQENNFEEIASYLTNPNFLGHGSTTEKHVYAFTDKPPLTGVIFAYSLSDVDYVGNVKRHPAIEIAVPGNTMNLPSDFALSRIYPNPFNPTAIISYKIPESTQVSITVYSVTGEFITSLVNERLEQGSYELAWSPTQLAAGVYLVKIQAGQLGSVQKCVLVK